MLLLNLLGLGQTAPKADPAPQLNYPFLPDERLVGLLKELSSFSEPVAKLVAAYTYDVLFGPEQWKSCWGATPVTLPSIEELRGRVEQDRNRMCLMLLGVPFKREEQLSNFKELLMSCNKPVEQMSAEECANLVGEKGQEEDPAPPQELLECLHRPVRPNEQLAGFTCTVTYIPSYVRVDDKIHAVTCRTLALLLGPKGANKAGLEAAAFVFHSVLKEADADGTEAPSYFVMERDCAPATKGKPYTAAALQIRSFGNPTWDLPGPRNFMAAVFSRRAWTGEFLFGTKQGGREGTFTSSSARGRHDRPLDLGYFGGEFSENHCSLTIMEKPGNWDENVTVNEDIGASGCRKFTPVDMTIYR